MSSLAIARQRDARMTADRRETKYLVARARARELATRIAEHLAPHRFRGEGGNRLPRAHHFITTVYFDTPSRSLFEAARTTTDHHLKLRAKEYYDLHPDLIETATDPRQIVRYQPVLWLEVKHRDGARTGKRRIGIPKRDVPQFFANGAITPEMVAIQDATYGADGAEVLAAVARMCAGCSEPLRADCLVNYRRTAWQDADDELRVTLDLDLAVYAPPADLWLRDWALVRSSLGPPVLLEPHAVLEVKGHGEPPAWLDRVLAESRAAAVSFSKFELASGAVHG